MLDRYGDPVGVGSHPHPMPLDELLEYLKNIDNFSLSPWVALAAQTEAIGDPATPSPEQIAILRWLGKALDIWEKQSPLEGRVAAQVRRLKPLSAALALTDPAFMQPGAHPLHQLLDSIQVRAIGWQARLDRVGAVLEQQVTKAVDDSRRWFDNQSTDLAGICAEFSTAAERDRARAKRMVQRVVEAEAGKVKTAAAKQEAARMINAALEKHTAPQEIGGFLKGPWYTSAQLLLLKFGAESEQWEKMSATTRTLLDSFQNTEGVDETRRQHIFEVVTQLPKEMRRWLLSLHHDTEAVNESMGLVEFAHLRILRRQPLDLLHIPPITVEGAHTTVEETQTPGAMRNWQEGQWFSVEAGKEGVLRVQLVLKVEQSQQLLFTNLAGIKVLQVSFTEFHRLITQDKVQALSSGASFSLCLAYAVGVDSIEVLDALANALAEAPPISNLQSKLHQDPEHESAATSTSQPQPLPESAPAAELGSYLVSYLDSEPESESESGLESDLELDLELDLESDLESELELHLQPEPNSELDEATHKDASSAPDPSGAGYLIEQAEAIKARGGYLVRRTVEQQDDTVIEEITAQAAENYPNSDSLAKKAVDSATYSETSPEVPKSEDALLERLLAQVGDGDTPAVDQAEPATDGEGEQEYQSTPGRQRREVNLPMGAWLGFHDGDTPLMARLAVYDLENDHYIFVNRKGVKMRQVSRLELLYLIDNGLVDILETNSKFRDEVTEARKSLDQE